MSLESQEERLLEDEERDEEPLDAKVDHERVIYWIFLVYGIAMLLPWNVFITASDYFASRFGSYHPNFQNYFSAYFNCANLVSLAVFLKIQKPVRIEIPLLINLLTFSFYAVSALLPPTSPTAYFWITIGFIVITGVTTSMMQASVVAEASQLVPKYMQAVMSGQGIAGVSVSLFSLITTIASSNSAFFYFLYAIIVTIAALYGRRKQTTFRHQETIRMTAVSHDIYPRQKQSIWDIIVKEIPGYICTVIYIYVITLALFPSRTVQIVSVNGINPSIFTSLHFLLFNIGDWIGRTIPLWQACQVFSSRLLLLFAVFRTCFIPLFAHVFDSDVIFFVLLLLFSVSNGWLTSLVFMAAPQHQAHPSLVGRVMSFFLVVGLAIGGITSFLIQ